VGWVEAVDTPQRVVLDMDSAEIPVYSQQEQSAHNGHFESTCCHPLLLFNRKGDCLDPQGPNGQRYGPMRALPESQAPKSCSGLPSPSFRSRDREDSPRTGRGSGQKERWTSQETYPTWRP